MIKFIKPSYEINMLGQTGIEKLKVIEDAARNCYASNPKTTETSYIGMIKTLIKNKHLSVFEYADVIIEFTCCRAFSHELVRHRMSSFAQQSQRYVKYNDNISFIIPTFSFLEHGDDETILNTNLEMKDRIWVESMVSATNSYNKLLEQGLHVQSARAVLPNSTATKIKIKTNIRELIHIKELRTAPSASPEMRELMIPLFKELNELIPIVFED